MALQCDCCSQSAEWAIYEGDVGHFIPPAPMVACSQHVGALLGSMASELFTVCRMPKSDIDNDSEMDIT